MSDGGHRRLTKEAGKDLVLLFLTLGLIVAGLLAFNKAFRDPSASRENDWYYERVAPPGTRNPSAPAAPRSTR